MRTIYTLAAALAFAALPGVALAERSWSLHHGLLGIPNASLSPGAYASYHDIPPSVKGASSNCRAKHGAPTVAAPPP